MSLLELLTSSIIAHGTVHINCESGGKVGQESDGRKRDSVHIGKGERSIYDNCQHQDWDDGTFVTKGNTVDHVGCSARLATVSELANGLVGVRGVVFGDESDDESAESSHNHTHACLPRVKGDNIQTDGGTELKLSRKEGLGSEVNGGNHQDCGANELHFECLLDISFLLYRTDISSDE